MQITARILRNWADEGGIPDLTLAELDYRLVHALRAIYTDPFLRDRLYLKGGTALNKLYLPGADRLSVDLDFNAVGSKEQVLQERTAIGEAIAAALEHQDSSYDLTYRGRYDQLTVYARFSPLSGTARQRLKVDLLAVAGAVEPAGHEVPPATLRQDVTLHHVNAGPPGHHGVGVLDRSVPPGGADLALFSRAHAVELEDPV